MHLYDSYQAKRSSLLLAMAMIFLLVGVGRATGSRPAVLAESQAGTVTGDAATVYLPSIRKSPPPAAPGPIYGVNFITSAEDPANAQQYQNGLGAGATWNRWPIYWFFVEQSPGQYSWARQDAAVQGDVAHGLQTNAILLGTPYFYTTSGPVVADPAVEAGEESPALPDDFVALPRYGAGPMQLLAPQAATPVGLYEPIFSDGSDVPGPAKEINPANKWASFVMAAVNRYKPGGILAQAQGWPAGAGITHWEMWNEPDLDIFWDSSLADYARLLKVGYLAAKQADPQAQILFGGLANNFQKINYYNDVMALYDADPLAPPHNYFHDILATHSYFYAWQSWFHVYRARLTLQARGLDKPIWLNENGVAAWSDYPGPTWDPYSAYRATLTEQADYIIQSAFFAAFAGADAIFHFQLYDGCGNQPAGTNFPPHSGELCDADGKLIYDTRFPCAGDANGLFRNLTTAGCFSQHPEPGTPRPNLAAFQILTTYLRGVEPLWRLRPGGSNTADGPQEWVAFFRPATSQRIVGLWARFGREETAVVPATGANALLLAADGSSQILTPVNGHYTLQLPAATNRNAAWDPALYAIGGRPFILIETDTLSPVVTAGGLSVGGGNVQLSWSGSDGLGSGMHSYDVYVSLEEGAAMPWLLQTTATGAVYTGGAGRQYTFTVYGRDRAGNVSEAAIVSIHTDELAPRQYLPLVVKP
jgi:hypothetical protein